jgi:hypothetical protein
LYWLEERPSEIFGWLPGLSGGYGSIVISIWSTVGTEGIELPGFIEASR